MSDEGQPPRRAGRPTSLTPEVQQRIVSAISAGNYYEAAAAYGGVDYLTMRRWMLRGEQEDEGIYREFRNAVLMAEAEAEATVVAQWRRQVPEAWQAARDFLARRHPDRWGPKERREVSLKGKVSLDVAVDLSSDADEDPSGEAGEAAATSPDEVLD